MDKEIAESRQRVTDFLLAESDKLEDLEHLFTPEANKYEQLLLSLSTILQNT